MSELIRIGQVDGIEPWRVVRNVLELNRDGNLIIDVRPIEGTNEYDVEIEEGTRAIVIGRLGQLACISIIHTRV